MTTWPVRLWLIRRIAGRKGVEIMMSNGERLLAVRAGGFRGIAP